MTARKRKSPKRRRGQFYIALEFWELESPAFAHLTADATRVYLFLRKRLNFDNGNNGAVPFSLRDASKALSASHWRRGANALAELEHYGFAKQRHDGEARADSTRGGIRLAAEWQLTAFPCGGQEASKDFMRWQGEAFVPPYRGKLGKRTAESREEAKKQLPTCNSATPRVQHERASPGQAASNAPETGQSACNMNALPADGRVQHEHTSTGTTQRGPLRRPWSAPAYSEPPIEPSERQQPIRPFLQPPKGNRRGKAAWLRAHLEAGVVTCEAVASALEIEPTHVAEIALGKSELGIAHWRKLAALVAERLH